MVRRSALVLLALSFTTSVFAQTPPWRPAANMHVERLTPTSVVLNDGRVLVVGQSGFAHTPDIYNPATNTWTLSGAMNTPARTGHRSGKLLDGKVIVVGGNACCLTGGVTYGVPVTEIFNPSTNTWFTASPAPAGRSNFGFSVLQDGRVLVSGGTSLPTATNNQPLASVDIYDPISDSWTAAPPMAQARWNHQQVVLNDGRVLVMSGHSNNGTPLATSEIYNPSTNTWSAGPTMKRARRDFTATKLQDGRVLAVGGLENNPSNFMNPSAGDTAEIYDPVANTWTLVVQTMSTGRREHASALMYDGKVLVTGGASPSGGGPLQTAELFDPASGTWTLSTMITQRMFHSAATLLDGRVLIEGGFDQNPLYTNKAELYGDAIPGTANAGPDQTVSGCIGCFSTVLLNGSGSVPGGGQTFTNYTWREGVTVVASSAQPTSTVTLGIGVHNIELTATQGDGQIATDSVVITVIDAIAAKDAQIAALQAQLAQALSDLADANATIAARDAQIAALGGQIADLNDQITALNLTNAALETANTSLQSQLNDANSQIQQLNDQITTLNGQVATLTADNAALTVANGTLATENAALTNTNQQLQASLTAANTQIGSLQGEVATLTATNQQLSEQVSQLTAANQQLTTENQALQASLTAANMQIQQLQGEVASLTSANQQLTSQNAQLTSDNAQLATANTQLTTANAQLTTLNQQLAGQLAVANQAVATCQAQVTTLNNTLTTGLNAVVTEFRASFNDPAFVIAGATPTAQASNVFNVLVNLKKADQKPVYKGLGGHK